MVLSTKMCDTYRIDRTPISSSQICAHAVEDQLPLDGDNGGALILDYYDGEKPTLIGIFSYASRGNTQKRSLIYTRVTSYIKWIEEATNIVFD